MSLRIVNILVSVLFRFVKKRQPQSKQLWGNLPQLDSAIFWGKTTVGYFKEMAESSSKCGTHDTRNVWKLCILEGRSFGGRFLVSSDLRCDTAIIDGWPSDVCCPTSQIHWKQRIELKWGLKQSLAGLLCWHLEQGCSTRTKIVLQFKQILFWGEK